MLNIVLFALFLYGAQAAIFRRDSARVRTRYNIAFFWYIPKGNATVTYSFPTFGMALRRRGEGESSVGNRCRHCASLRRPAPFPGVPGIVTNN